MNEKWEDTLRVGTASGLLAGLLTGAAARIAMRIFALADGMEPTFSLEGTLTILLIFGVVLGVPLGVIYVRFWRPLTGISPRNGLAFGVLLLLVLVALPFMLIPSDEATLVRRLIAIGSFVPVPLVYGLAVGRAAKHWLPSIAT